MNPPFLLYDHGDSRRMVIPDAFYDEISDPYAVCQRLSSVAMEHHVSVEVREWIRSGGGTPQDDDCASNPRMLDLRFAWPHRSDLDRPSLFITECVRSDGLYVRPLTVEDCMPMWQRRAERVLA